MPHPARELVKAQIKEGFLPARGQVGAMCRTLGASQRSLRRWRTKVRNGEGPCRLGRPPHGEEKRAEVLALVQAQLAIQGASAGRGAILKALAGKGVSARLVQESLRLLKGEARKQRTRAEAKTRTSVEVLAKDALWAQDATALTPGSASRRSEAEVIRDAGTTTMVTASVREGPARSREVIAVLEKAIAERGGAPLVQQTDNGPAYCSKEMESWLQEHRIVHLKTLPHTPKHNAVAERANGELKMELRAMGTIAAREQIEVDRAAACLNRRLRRSRGWQSAQTLDKRMVPAYALVSRETFYTETMASIARATAGVENPRARRLAERRAILETMVRFGLIKVSVGGRAAMVPNADNIS